MAKNTGMNGKDDRAGKTAGLNTIQSQDLYRHLEEEANEPAPTKTVESLNKARGKKKNETTGTLLMHKPVGQKG